MYTEAQMASDFSKYLRTNSDADVLKFPFAVEYKLKKNNKPLNFKADLQPQQLPMLLKTLSGCVYHKISDMTPGIKPYDAIQICHAPAFLAVMWYEPRKPKTVYLIDARMIEDTIKKGFKSIGKEEALLMATFTVNI